jgi:NADPH-ferrihemoprotein reductase
MARKSKQQPAVVAPADTSADVLLVAVAACALLLTVLLLRWKRSQRSAVGLRTSAKPARKPAASKGPMTILWGSQTGTAEGFASVLMREARQHGYAARSVDLEELEPDELAETRGPVVFLMATQGEGDPTDNAVAFYKWANEPDRAADALAAVSFAAFGLGNRQYEHFNSMGKWVDTRLPQLGATRLLELGLGDDDADIEADFEAWRAALWSTLCPQDAGEAGAPQPNFAAEIVGSAIVTNPDPPLAWLQLLFPKQKLVASELLVSRELCRDTSQGSVRHMEIATAAGQDQAPLLYSGADDLAVLCDNGAQLATATAERLGLSARATFRLRPLSGGVGDLPGPAPPLPTPCTVSDAFRYFADLRAPVSKQLLLLLSEHASDPAQAARLAHLASAAGKDEYSEYIHAQERGLSELLLEFSSSAPPFGPLLELVPKLSPRYYTISSASSLDRSTLHITVKIIKEPMHAAPHRTKIGVCTAQLEAAPVGSKIVSFVRPSHFRLPQDPNTPVVMVGPGTGIAPFRAFLQEMKVRCVCVCEGGGQP